MEHIFNRKNFYRYTANIDKYQKLSHKGVKMNMENKHDPSRYLEIFDTLKLNDVCERRTAYKPLYEFFQKLILEVGVELCELNRNSLKTFHLKSRWDTIKCCLSYIEDPEIWDGVIYEISNIRQKVEHNDYCDPKPTRLAEIRKKAPNFKEWILKVAEEYYKKSKNFTFKEAFYRLSKWYIDEANCIIQEYSKNPPYVAKLDYPVEFEDSYEQISELMKELQERLKSIAKLEDIEHLDLEKLIQIVKIISHFKGKEKILLKYRTCPKCGGKIKETREYFGGTPDYPEPDGIYIQISCEKCGYEVYSETINI